MGRAHLGLIFFVLLLGFVMPSLLVDTANAWFAWALLATASLFLLFTASVAVAILRHHLYDINRLVSRTLTYGLLTVVLGTLYAGAVVGLGQALNPEAATPRSPWPPPRSWWPRCFDRCGIASRPRSTGASTGRATTRPGAWRRSAPGSGSRWIWTGSRPTCWLWSSRPWSRRRCGCGCGPSATIRQATDRRRPPWCPLTRTSVLRKPGRGWLDIE